MPTLHAIVLGIVQGLTEFLPISSTGHLRIVPALLGWDDPGTAFVAIVQLGTVAAVLIYFRDDLIRIARAWVSSLARREWWPDDRDARMGWYVILGTIPVSVFGLAFKDQLETDAPNLYLIASALIVFGLLLLAADRTGKRERTMDSLDLRDGVAVGFAQAFALIPGVSRSGATITAGLFRGLDREAAARFSFLLSVPAIVLSGLFEFSKVARGDESTSTAFAPLAIATVLAFIVGYASIAFLLRYLQTHSMVAFVVYRVALGTLVLALLAAGAIH